MTVPIQPTTRHAAALRSATEGAACCARRGLLRNPQPPSSSLLTLRVGIQRRTGANASKTSPITRSVSLLPLLNKQVQRLEARIKLLEDESRGGIDITKFYNKGSASLPPVAPPDDIVG